MDTRRELSQMGDLGERDELCTTALATVRVWARRVRRRCDKSLGSVCLAGHVMRFSTVQFGGCTSHGPLSLFVDAVYQILRDSAEHRDVAGGGFVDDLFFMLCS